MPGAEDVGRCDITATMQTLPRRIGYLNGLRGLAALQVVLGHYTNAFMRSWFAKLGLVVNGDFAVLIFFLMSGFVLTPSFERQPNAVAAGLVRRIIRIGLPTAAACVFAYLLRAAWADYAVTAARLSGSAWLAGFEAATLRRAIADTIGLTMVTGYADTTLFAALVSSLPPVVASVNVPIWSLHVELWGSALVLLLVFLRARATWLYVLCLVLCMMFIGGNALDLFAVGSLLSVLSRRAWFARLLAQRWRPFAAALLLVLGAWLGTAPFGRGAGPLENMAMSHSVVLPFDWFSWSLEVAALTVFVALMLLPEVHRLLETRVPQWLGRMSFPIYLLHFPIMMTAGCAVFIRAVNLGQGVAALAALAVGLCLTLVLSIAFERWVDQPAIAMARRFRRGVRSRSLSDNGS